MSARLHVCPRPLGGKKGPAKVVGDSEREVTAVAAWVWILIIVLLVLVLFGGVGYSRR